VARDEPPGQGGGRNGEADFHGQKRSNDTHASTTDLEARLYRKGLGKEAKLCFLGHALLENRDGLFVDACLTQADGHAERIAALHMIEPRADRPEAITLGAGRKNFQNLPRLIGTSDALWQFDAARTLAVAQRRASEI
jgi:hypothetical protein